MADYGPQEPKAQRGFIVENGRQIHRVPGMADVDLGPADQGGTGDKTLPKPLEFLLNPELASTATSLAADAVFPEERGAKIGMRLARHVALPAAIGAGTSIMNDLRNGDTDLKDMAGGAIYHGGLNAFPGTAGEASRLFTRAPAVASEAALGTLKGGPKGGLAGALKGFLFGAPEVVAPAAAATSGIADVTLPGGIKATSPQGVKFLESELNTLRNQIKFNSGRVGPMGTVQNTVDPTLAAKARVLERMITQARAAGAGAAGPGEMLTKAFGIPTGSITADAAEAATKAAQQKALTLAARIRQILGITTAGASESGLLPQ